ncbi:MAG: hypothetical protein GY830_09645 [Bacteroidetes bacterium]|nr:hypothetical protein [Bacteroidota bacterium]
MKKVIYIFLIFNSSFCSYKKEKHLMNSNQNKLKTLQYSKRNYHNNHKKFKNKNERNCINNLEKISENEILINEISIFLKEYGNTKETLVEPNSSIGLLKQYIIKNAGIPFENEDIVLKYNNIILEDCFKLKDYQIVENSIIDFMISPNLNLEAIIRNINFYLDMNQFYANRLDNKLKSEIKEIMFCFKKSINKKNFKNPFKQNIFILNCEYFNFINEFMFGLSRYFNVLDIRTTDNNIIKNLYLRNEDIQKDLVLCNSNLENMNKDLQPVYLHENHMFILDKHFLSSAKDRFDKFIKGSLIKYNDSFNNKLINNTKIGKNYIKNKLIKLRDLKNQMEIEYRISKYIIIGAYLIHEYKKLYFHFLKDFNEIKNIRIEIIELLQKNKQLLSKLSEVNKY